MAANCKALQTTTLLMPVSTYLTKASHAYATPEHLHLQVPLAPHTHQAQNLPSPKTLLPLLSVCQARNLKGILHFSSLHNQAPSSVLFSSKRLRNPPPSSSFLLPLYCSGHSNPSLLLKLPDWSPPPNLQPILCIDLSKTNLIVTPLL